MDNNVTGERFYQVFWIHLIAELWFVLTYIFIHNNFDYLVFMVPVVLSNIVLLYFYRKTKDYEKYAGIMFFIGTIYLSVLVYSAGGMKAPASFTFALIPIGSAFFFDVKYMKSSFILCLALFTLVMIMGEVYPPSPLLMNYQEQKILNTIFFIVLFFFCVRSFVMRIEAKDKEINKQKDSIQNLLRILIHDIATPLTTAMGRIDILKIDNENEHGKAIKRSLNTITNIIEDVRRLEQIGNGKLELCNSQFKLSTLFEELLTELDEKLNKKKLEVKIEYPSELEFTADYSLLKNNILMNLLTNAIKFSEEGQRILISCIVEEELTIEIIDNGEGIPPEILENIFSPDKATTRRGTKGERGSGFGMPIVKKVIELMEGEIKINSNYPSPSDEIGTSIKIKLPLFNLRNDAII